MAYDCKLEQRSPQPTLVVRTRTSIQDLPQELGRTFGSIARYLAEINEQPIGPPFAAYHNMDMDNLDVEIGFPVRRALPGRDEIQPSSIPGGEVATCVHTGPYDKVGRAYQALTRFVEEQGREVEETSYELYLSDPGSTSPDERQTLILIPLAEL